MVKKKESLNNGQDLVTEQVCDQGLAHFLEEAYAQVVSKYHAQVYAQIWDSNSPQIFIRVRDLIKEQVKGKIILKIKF